LPSSQKLAAAFASSPVSSQQLCPAAEKAIATSSLTSS